MFKHRLISTSILVPCIVITLFLVPLLEFKIITLLICMLSSWEWGKLSKLTFSSQKKWLLLMFLLLSIIFKASTCSDFFNIQNNQFVIYIIFIWWSIAILLLIFYPNSANLWKKYTILWLIFGMLIILPFFWGVLILRNYCYNEDYYTGAWLLLYILSSVWGIDSFSYIIGRTFGHHKAVPKISPKKTWEGYIGGLLIMVIIFLIISKYIPTITKLQKIFLYSIIVLSSILGDLIESMFKREANIKDSSKLIPGHGGILDAMDGLYSTIPISACFVLLTNN